MSTEKIKISQLLYLLHIVIKHNDITDAICNSKTERMIAYIVKNHSNLSLQLDPKNWKDKTIEVSEINDELDGRISSALDDYGLFSPSNMQLAILSVLKAESM